MSLWQMPLRCWPSHAVSTGEKRVGVVREDCVVSSINLLEARSKLVRYDVPAEQVKLFLRESFPRVIPVDRELAESSAVFHAATRDARTVLRGLRVPDARKPAEGYCADCGVATGRRSSWT